MSWRRPAASTQASGPDPVPQGGHGPLGHAGADVPLLHHVRQAAQVRRGQGNGGALRGQQAEHLREHQVGQGLGGGGALAGGLEVLGQGLFAHQLLGGVGGQAIVGHVARLALVGQHGQLLTPGGQGVLPGDDGGQVRVGKIAVVVGVFLRRMALVLPVCWSKRRVSWTMVSPRSTASTWRRYSSSMARCTDWKEFRFFISVRVPKGWPGLWDGKVPRRSAGNLRSSCSR